MVFLWSFVDRYWFDCRYCKCEMPYNPDDLMVQCEGCKDWYFLLNSSFTLWFIGCLMLKCVNSFVGLRYPLGLI